MNKEANINFYNTLSIEVEAPCIITVIAPTATPEDKILEMEY